MFDRWADDCGTTAEVRPGQRPSGTQDREEAERDAQGHAAAVTVVLLLRMSRDQNRLFNRIGDEITSDVLRQTSVQFQQTGLGRPEAAGPVVERAQMIFEVHVQVLTLRRLGAASGAIDQFGADVPAPCLGGDHSVLQPGMNEAVPEHVDEADEFAAIAGHHPAEAVLVDKLHPVPLGLVKQPGIEGFGMQRIDLVIRESAPPLVADRHQTNLRGAYRLGVQALVTEGRGTG